MEILLTAGGELTVGDQYNLVLMHGDQVRPVLRATVAAFDQDGERRYEAVLEDGTKIGFLVDHVIGAAALSIRE